MGISRFLGIFRFIIVLFIIGLLSGCGGSGGGGGSSTQSLSPEQVEELENASNTITERISDLSDNSITDILEEAKATALTQSAVVSAEIFDEQLLVKYKYDREEIWLLNHPYYTPADLSHEPETMLTSMVNSYMAFFKSSVITSSGYMSAINFNGLSDDPDENAVIINCVSEDDKFQYHSDFTLKNIKRLLEARDYNVLELNGPDASPENLKQLSKFSVIIMYGHGGRSKDCGFEAQTGKRWEKSDYQRGEIIRMNVLWGDTFLRKIVFRSFCAVTENFWVTAYDSSHFQNALFMNLACYSSSCPSYYETLEGLGVSAYTGWSDVTKISASSAWEILKLMAEGKTFDSAYEDLPNGAKSSGEASLYHGPESGYDWILNGSEPIYAVQGNVQDNNVRLLSGVHITLDGPLLTFATTDSAGNYCLLTSAKGSYSLTPSLTGYSFNPSSIELTIEDKGVNVQPLYATASSENRFSVSGKVTLNGSGLAGVSVTLSDSGSKTTDSTGTYAFTDIANGSYTLTFSSADYTFDPSSVNVTIDNIDYIAPNIIAIRQTSPEPLAVTFKKIFRRNIWDSANSVQQTSDGGYIFAGETGTNDNMDFWIIKTDATGVIVWERTFGGGFNESCYYVRQTNDGGYILAGQTNSFGMGDFDAWLIKTDSAGNMVWDRTFGGNLRDSVYSVQQTSDGGYIIAGSTITLSSGVEKFDAWLIKTDSAGNMVWDRTFAGAGNLTDHANSVQQTNDGGYILAGVTDVDGGQGGEGEGYDVWLIKTDSAGNMVWDRTFGFNLDDYVSSVQQTSDGGYILAGTSYYQQGWLMKTDMDGNITWRMTLANGNGRSAQQTSDGGYILAVSHLLIKTDANGNKVWERPFNASSYSVQQTIDEGYIMAGTIGSDGITDAILIKTDADGNAPASATP